MSLRLLCTCPGRHGDILLALPTLRAIAERLDTVVDLVVSPPYVGVCALAEHQPYVGDAYSLDDWAIVESAPMSPREPPTIPPDYDHVFHLGYDGWPELPLAYEHFRLLLKQWPATLGLPPEFDLLRPWLTAQPPVPIHPSVSLGWSPEWLELKVGLTTLVAQRFPDVQFRWIRPWGHGRWDEIGTLGQALPSNALPVYSDFAEAAHQISRTHVFLGCNSALSHVATGLGVPVVLMEPAEARWHPIFYSYGQDGPEVRLVKGNDGRPTFDARHVGDALAEALKGRS